jgi:2-oxoglutarate ferredoxin oxidoreductase subunit alpha
MREAVNQARASGENVSALHLKHLFPLPPGLEKIFDAFNHIRVVELNDESLYGYGQLGGLLRARFCSPKILGINKVEGLTWKVKEILERIKPALAKETART